MAALTRGSWRTRSLTDLRRRCVGVEDSLISDIHESCKHDNKRASGNWPKNLKGERGEECDISLLFVEKYAAKLAELFLLT